MKGKPLPKELVINVCIFLVALAVRLIYLYQSSDNPSFEAPVIDSGLYDITARLVAAGKGINDNNNFFWQPPFYPAFLALIYSISHGSILFAKITQALLGCISCLLTCRLGTKIFNRTAGIIAGIIVAVYGPLVFFESELLAAGWTVIWSPVLILLLLRVSTGSRLWPGVGLGICSALSILTHPTFLLFLMASFVWLAIYFYRHDNRRRRPVLKLAAILAGFSLVALPVAVVNLRITGHFGILPASGGINFFVGNNPDYIKTITARPGRDWAEITGLPGKNGVAGDLWEQQKYFNTRVVDFVLSEPLAFARGLVQKTIQLISSREIPRNIDLYLFGQWSGLLGLLVWRVNEFGFPFGVILPLSLLGLIGCRRRIPVPLKLFLLFYPLSLILVFVAARYRVPIIPALSVLAAAGLLKLIDMIRERSWRRLSIAGIGGVVVVLISTLPGPFPEEQVNYEAELYANVAGRELDFGQTDKAIGHLNKALSLNFDYPSAHGNLGMALTRKGRLDESIRHYKIALELDDASAEVHNNLAIALAGLNRSEEALDHYVGALQLNPDYAEAHYNLGNLLLSMGRIEDAMAHLTRAVQTEKDFFEAHNSLAAALAQKGDIEGAIENFLHAIRLQPNEQQPRYNLAVTLAGCGRTDEAISEFRKLLTIPPRSPIALDCLARLLLMEAASNTRNRAEAVDLAEKACGLTAYRHPYFLDTLAQAYAATGNFAEAAVTAEKALQITVNADRKDKSEYFQRQLEYYRTKITK